MKKNDIHWGNIAASNSFIKLHKDKNRFLWFMMLFALVYFFCLPIATAYFQEIFKIKVWGVINLGLLFALSQFIVAWLIAAFYANRANKRFDINAQAIIEEANNTVAKKGDSTCNNG